MYSSSKVDFRFSIILVNELSVSRNVYAKFSEVILLHHPSKTLVVSDVLYKSTSEVVGPGGKENHYSLPLRGLHRDNRNCSTRNQVTTLMGLDYVLGFACHTDLMEGDDARRLLRTAWKWVWDELENGVR